MSLKSFHIVFVTLSSLLATVFGVWSLRSHPALSAMSFAFGALLVVYGFWFWKKITTREEEKRRRRKHIHPVPIMIALWMLASSDASACSVCYGEAEGPMIDAARLGVFLLFGLVLFMQVVFGAFFVQLWRRSRQQKSES